MFAVDSMVHQEPNTIDCLDNAILVKIFSLVLEPFDSDFEPTSNAKKSPEKPSNSIVGFEHFTVLPKVCRRWRRAINDSPELWQHIKICCWGWPKQMNTLWYGTTCGRYQAQGSI